MQFPPFIGMKFETFLTASARRTPNHLFLVGKSCLWFKHVNVFHVEKVDALLKTGVHDYDAGYSAVHIVGATIEPL